MSISLACPRCEYTIRSAVPGTTILCPSCRGRVTVPAAEKPDPGPAKAAEPPGPKPGGEYDGDESPVRKAKRRSNVPLLVGGGLALLAIVGGFAATALFTARDRARQRADVERARYEIDRARGQQGRGFGPVDDGDPLRPTEHAAAATAAELDRLAAQWPAIPQDAERQLRTARAAWARKTLDGAFDRSARAARPWAPQARIALALRARELSFHPEFAQPLLPADPTGKALSDAVAAGCDDPLVQYFHLRAFFRDDMRLVPLRDLRRVAQSMGESDYSPVWRAYVAHDLLLALSAAKAPAAEVAAGDKQFWEAVGRAAADPDPVAQDHVVALAGLREGSARVRGGTREGAYDEVAAALQKAGAPEYTRQVVRGRFLIHHAWDARGGGFADTVTAEGRRLMEERLTAAQAALTAAYERDPERPHAPTLMLLVCKGRNRPRPEMETWFERAMRADPDNFQACLSKLEYLQPKWHGTPEEYIGFAWQCVQTGNGEGLLPYAAAANIAANVPLPARFPPGYLEQVEPYYAEHRVWQVLHAAMTSLDRLRPELRWVRGDHVRFALVAGRHDLALRLLDEMGEDPRHGGFLFADDLSYYREWAKTGRPPLR